MKNLLIFILLCAEFVAFGQDSLARYEQIALSNNPELKALLAEHQAALLKAPIAASLPDPTAEFGIFLEPMHLLGGKQLAEMKIMQMFPWFGTLKAAKDEASQMAMAKFYIAEDFKLNLLRTVRIAYVELIKTKEEITLLNENLELLRSIEKVSLSKFSSNSGASNSVSMKQKSAANSTSNSGSGMGGMGGNSSTNPVAQEMNSGTGSGMNAGTAGSLTEVLQIQLEIAALENKLANLAEQLSTQKNSFNALLNSNLFAEVYLPSAMQNPAEFANAISDSVYFNHPMYKMQESDLAAALAEKQMAKRMGMPMLGLGLNYSLIGKREGNTDPMNGKDMLMPMVAVTLPIYRAKYKAGVQIADAKATTALERKTSTLNMLKLSYLNAEKQKNEALRNKKLSLLQIQLSEQILTMQMAQFVAGKTGLEDILRIREQLLKVKIEQLTAETNYTKAVFEMKYVMNE